jgi:hypothetical protein
VIKHIVVNGRPLVQVDDEPPHDRAWLINGEIYTLQPYKTISFMENREVSTGDFKGTPGPWDQIVVDEDCAAIYPEFENMFIDRNIWSTESGDIAHCYGPDKEANALLIAAAPDLLKALIQLVKCPTNSSGDGMHVVSVDHVAYVNVLAAIAKATGG